MSFIRSPALAFVLYLISELVQLPRYAPRWRANLKIAQPWSRWNLLVSSVRSQFPAYIYQSKIIGSAAARLYGHWNHICAWWKECKNRYLIHIASLQPWRWTVFANQLKRINENSGRNIFQLMKSMTGGRDRHPYNGVTESYPFLNLVTVYDESRYPMSGTKIDPGQAPIRMEWYAWYHSHGWRSRPFLGMSWKVFKIGSRVSH